MASVEDLGVLYVVPQNRNFVWPTIEIGRKVTVPHVKTPLGKLFTARLLFVVIFLVASAILAPKVRKHSASYSRKIAKLTKKHICGVHVVE